jgi:hypothetical protein
LEVEQDKILAEEGAWVVGMADFSDCFLFGFLLCRQIVCLLFAIIESGEGHM